MTNPLISFIGIVIVIVIIVSHVDVTAVALAQTA